MAPEDVDSKAIQELSDWWMDSIPRTLVITCTPDISSICPQLVHYRSLSDKATRTEGTWWHLWSIEAFYGRKQCSLLFFQGIRKSYSRQTQSDLPLHQHLVQIQSKTWSSFPTHSGYISCKGYQILTLLAKHFLLGGSLTQIGVGSAKILKYFDTAYYCLDTKTSNQDTTHY